MRLPTLYLECASGISGDMAVAAFLHLGADRQKLAAVLKSLPLDDYSYAISEKASYGIAGLDFEVTLHHAHDSHELASHPHKHRHLADIHAIIDRGAMSERAAEIAKKIFAIVAKAESEAHQCLVEAVSFHEVGAVDSIIDIVAAAVCFDDLGLKECVVVGLTEGSGFVHCQHGDLPVPVPASTMRWRCSARARSTALAISNWP